MFSVLRRESSEWRDLYAKRQTIERTFNSLKQSRRLERHHTRGLRNITLHCLLSVIVYQATVLVNARRGARKRLRWQVPVVL